MTTINFNERYSRQIRLPKIGELGQQKLHDASVLIIGMGGLAILRALGQPWQVSINPSGISIRPQGQLDEGS